MVLMNKIRASLIDKRRRWLYLGVLFALVIGISIGLAFLLRYLGQYLAVPLERFASLAYLTVFGTTLACNLTVIVPVPIATTIMIAAASAWNPILIALVASVGGTLGEISGYYVGYLGKRIVFDESVVGYDKVVGWVNRYGFWAILLLAFQPVFPFDVAGIIAGASKMPLWKFLAACWTGKFPKYILFCYTGIGVLHFLLGWFQ